MGGRLALLRVEQHAHARLIVHTLGIAPAEPGFTRARVTPALGDLEWAEATVPTPHGPLHVRADRSGVAVNSAVPFETPKFES